MSKALSALLLTLFFAHAAMTASVLSAEYDKETQVVILGIFYCYHSTNAIKVELVPGSCKETSPQQCDVELVVHNEGSHNFVDTCIGEWIEYDVSNLAKPANVHFHSSDGSRQTVYVR